MSFLVAMLYGSLCLVLFCCCYLIFYYVLSIIGGGFVSVFGYILWWYLMIKMCLFLCFGTIIYFDYNAPVYCLAITSGPYIPCLLVVGVVCVIVVG